MAGLSYLRFAAVCVLAAGLLIGGVGGAVAVADPDAGGSTADSDHETNGSGKQPSASVKKPKDDPGGTDTKGEKKDPSGTDTKPRSVDELAGHRVS